MSERKVVIVGGGVFGREVHNLGLDIYSPHSADISFPGYVDQTEHPRTSANLPYLGNDDWLLSQHNPKLSYVLALGNPGLREKVGKKLQPATASPFSLIHPTVLQAPGLVHGPGLIACAGVIMTTDIELGKFVVINLHCSIGHDCRLGDYVSLHPGVRLSGGVSIGKGCEIGSGAVILPGVRIGQNCRIGAGAVVNKDCEEGKTYVGVPARELTSPS